MNSARLAVDIGGTFTDVALDMAGRERVTAKTLTTHQDPGKGVLTAIAEVLQKAELAPSDISVIIHGTTLATNALIERRGATTALLTTEGHRDSLEMAYENRFEQYDINIDRPKPLVPRWLRLPIRERMNKDGEALIPLDEESVNACLPILEKEGVESVAIGFLHAYANRAHEERTAEIIRKARPDLPITLASEVAPEIREYERLSTAVANAYVRPLMETYLLQLEKELRKREFDCPFFLISSGAGLLTLETAARFPIRLVESGPAGGAVLASAIARECDLPALVSFDMGGTTAKLCLIDNFEPQTSRTFEVDRSYRFKKGSGLPVRIPVIEMVEIGAGGGSIASIDKMNRIQTGPESAGSEPGPVAYDRGGEEPTVTDADIALGKIVPEDFAGGSIQLNVKAAQNALEKKIGGPLSLEGDNAAFGVSEIVDENMANAARAHAIEGGQDIAARAMVAFGGAAPLHASRLAEKLGIERVVIPTDAGVGSAVGFLLAPVAYEVVRSKYMRLDEYESEIVSGIFSDMRKEAEAVVQPALDGVVPDESCQAYMRYAGQGHEIAVELTGEPETLSPAELQKSFEKKYTVLFGRIIPDMPIEILTWALTLKGPVQNVEKAAEVGQKKKPAHKSVRDVFDPGLVARSSYSIYQREDLQAGDHISGPALIVESQTTTVVTEAFDAGINSAGHILLIRKAVV